MKTLKCIICGSYAINPQCHGREPDEDLDLCDVCYYRKKYSELLMKLYEERSIANVK